MANKDWSLDKRVVLGASLAIATGLGWMASRSYIEKFVPYQWQYRPGTITGYLAQLLTKYAKRRRRTKPIRVYMDGCFDMMHYGHANALRQAKACGDVLVVGLIPDSEIAAVKGPPVMNEQERLAMVESIKWVDEVVTDVPYNLTAEFLHELFTKHNIDFVVHGDDPCFLPDGTDAYAEAKRLGRFKVIKRTEGVSSTDIVGRMLMCTASDRSRSRHARTQSKVALAEHFSAGDLTDSDTEEAARSGAASPTGSLGGRSWAVPRTRLSSFMPTSRRIVQFSEGKTPAPGARVIYIDGAFDVFHVGHVEALKRAKQMGDFLLVGIHGDEEVNASHNNAPHLPIMNVYERALSVLSCRYVDEAIIGAPRVINDDLLKTFNISMVVRGTICENSLHTRVPGEPDCYALPKRMGIFQEIPSDSPMTTTEIVTRIVANREAYEERNRKKNKSEAKYYGEAKAYVAEL